MACGVSLPSVWAAQLYLPSLQWLRCGLMHPFSWGGQCGLCLCLCQGDATQQPVPECPPHTWQNILSTSCIPCRQARTSVSTIMASRAHQISQAPAATPGGVYSMFGSPMNIFEILTNFSYHTSSQCGVKLSHMTQKHAPSGVLLSCSALVHTFLPVNPLNRDLQWLM